KVNRAKKVKKVDLGAIFDAHVRHEFVDHDVAAAMKTMVAEPCAQRAHAHRRWRPPWCSRFLHTPLRRQNACRYTHRADLADGGQGPSGGRAHHIFYARLPD